MDHSTAFFGFQAESEGGGEYEEARDSEGWVASLIAMPAAIAAALFKTDRRVIRACISFASHSLLMRENQNPVR